MKCPSCGAQAEGAFCSECGAPLKGAQCRECQAALSAGARFCNNCGAPTGHARRGNGVSDARLPWLFAGISLLALVAVIVAVSLRGDDAPGADNQLPLDQVSGVGGAATPAPGPLTGTPREQADRLFNRVMSERESGDTAQAKFFVPMAVQAYGMAGDLDADGYYHMSLLQNFGGDHAAALTTAERVLATSPDHLLGLSAAAQAARASGDNTVARRYYQRFIDAFDREIKTAKPEYQDHGNMLPQLKAEAEAFVETGAQ